MSDLRVPAEICGLSHCPILVWSDLAPGRTHHGEHRGTRRPEILRTAVSASSSALRGERYKYVFNGFDEDELYDLQEDPHELVNLARRPGSQEVLRELAAAMWRVVKETGDDTLAQAEYGMFRFAPVGPRASE